MYGRWGDGWNRMPSNSKQLCRFNELLVQCSTSILQSPQFLLFSRARMQLRNRYQSWVVTTVCVPF